MLFFVDTVIFAHFTYAFKIVKYVKIISLFHRNVWQNNKKGILRKLI